MALIVNNSIIEILRPRQRGKDSQWTTARRRAWGDHYGQPIERCSGPGHFGVLYGSGPISCSGSGITKWYSERLLCDSATLGVSESARDVRAMCTKLLIAKVSRNAFQRGAISAPLIPAVFVHYATSPPSTFSFTALRGRSNNAVVRSGARRCDEEYEL